MPAQNIWDCSPVEISDEDIIKAMKTMEGYVDITPNDFREVYRVAYAVAMDRLLNALKASDVMTVPVLVVDANLDLIATAALLDDNGISGAPVVDASGSIVGVVSEKDFIKTMGAGAAHSFMAVISNCLKNKGCLALPMRNRKSTDIMTAPAVTASKEATVSEISTLLSKFNINRVPIVDDSGKPIGIVTRSDLVTSYCRLDKEDQ